MRLQPVHVSVPTDASGEFWRLLGSTVPAPSPVLVVALLVAVSAVDARNTR
ncbi:hypothetical protein [Actinokineospora globicatena]|uniref:Uncharacterized protein n=1 Tax=Actinokineospora globicatena TaxID=103729 RepID=A0A9W6QK07_9PSEU|nr:hypothetical protein [Actinokineospora globicatena]GLW89919.1 hypothetical protein Aglo03_07350 [Actinokineospora globicatena]